MIIIKTIVRSFYGSGGDEIGAGYSYYLIPWYLDLLKGTDKEKLKKDF